jgi:PAS domain-containing protein
MVMVQVPFYWVMLGLGAWGIRRFGSNPLFGNLKALAVFVLIAIVLVPVVDQTLEAGMLSLSGAGDVWSAAVPNMLCVALGTLIATPALTLTLANGRAWLAANSWKEFVEVAVLANGLLAVGHLCFGRPASDSTLPALLYAPLPLLVWAAVRFELAGVSWALLAIALQSTWGAVHGRGPFASQTPADSVLQIQLFLLAMSLPLMVLATVIRERRQAYSALTRAEREVREEYAQLTTLYRSAPVGLSFVDTQLRYVHINDELAEIHGPPADAHIGRTVREVYPQYADIVEPVYRRVLSTGQPVLDVEVRAPGPAGPGSERTWLVSRYPVGASRQE